MARKTVDIIITDDGRDKGKTFIIQEMPPTKTEAWAMRALMALIKGGAQIPAGTEQPGVAAGLAQIGPGALSGLATGEVQIPAGTEQLGVAGLAQIGFGALSGLATGEVQKLLDEMLDSFSIRPDRNKPFFSRKIIDDDIEEVMTLLKLRKEWWGLHMDFLISVPQLFSQTEENNGK